MGKQRLNVLLIIILVSCLLGTGYASWQDTLLITTTIQTADMNIDSGEYASKLIVNGEWQCYICDKVYYEEFSEFLDRVVYKKSCTGCSVQNLTAKRLIQWELEVDLKNTGTINSVIDGLNLDEINYFQYISSNDRVYIKETKIESGELRVGESLPVKISVDLEVVSRRDPDSTHDIRKLNPYGDVAVEYIQESVIDGWKDELWIYIASGQQEVIYQ